MPHLGWQAKGAGRGASAASGAMPALSATSRPLRDVGAARRWGGERVRRWWQCPAAGVAPGAGEGEEEVPIWTTQPQVWVGGEVVYPPPPSLSLSETTVEQNLWNRPCVGAGEVRCSLPSSARLAGIDVTYLSNPLPSLWVNAGGVVLTGFPGSRYT